MQSCKQVLQTGHIETEVGLLDHLHTLVLESNEITGRQRA